MSMDPPYVKEREKIGILSQKSDKTDKSNKRLLKETKVFYGGRHSG